MAEPISIFDEFEGVDHEMYDFANCATALDPTGPLLRQDVYAALFASEGNISTAAALLGNKRSRLDRYLKANPEFYEILENFTETLVDNAEAHSNAAVTTDLVHTRWYLERKGKARGYNTRSELTGANGVDLIKSVNEFVSDEQLRRIAEQVSRARSG